jgi:UDP:flavonoid glycosyltransferase YjiC (YdhE family)
MSRIVLMTIGSLGDLHPFIAIGLGLRDRSHNIVIKLSELVQRSPAPTPPVQWA